MQIHDVFVEVPGGQLFTRRWTPDNAGDRSPMILLHDSLGCVALWREFPQALAQRLAPPVIAYDRLGFGQSTMRAALPAGDFVHDEATRYFPALRQALEFTRFSLFGHSVGGAMALIIAATFGDDCEAVITEAAQAYVEERTLEGIRAAQAQFAQPGALDKLTKWHGPRAAWVLNAWTQVWLSPERRSWTLLPDLSRVRSPVLAIHGDTDEYGSLAFPHCITEQVRGPSEQAILTDCGHVPHREQQPVVLDRVAAFLDRLAPSTQQDSRDSSNLQAG